MTTEAVAVLRAPGAARLCMALAGIYVVQSLVTGMATQALPAVLRSMGASLQSTGLAFLVLAPWVLKGLWAPWVERWRLPEGRLDRRSRGLILAGQGLVVVLLALLAAWGLGAERIAMQEASRIVPIVVLLALAALVTATVDIAADGFAIDQLPPRQRGWGNVAQVGGSYAGMALGGSAFILLYQHAGWAAATAAMALLAAAFTFPLWQLSEPPRRSAATATVQHRASMRAAWQRPELRSGLLLVFCLGLGVRLSLGMLGPWLLDRGVGMTQLATLWGLGGLCAGLVGTLGGGLLVQRAGVWLALHAALALEALALVLVAACALLSLPSAWLLSSSVLLLMAVACGFVARYTWLMGLTDPRQPGLDFTLFQCTDAAVALLGGVAGGWLAGTLGHSHSLALAASCGVMALAWPSLSRRSGARRCGARPSNT